jgi:hypothetical protein
MLEIDLVEEGQIAYQTFSKLVIFVCGLCNKFGESSEGSKDLTDTIVNVFNRSQPSPLQDNLERLNLETL